MNLSNIISELLCVLIQYNIPSSCDNEFDVNGKVVDNHLVEIFLYTATSSLANGQVPMKPCSDLRKLCFVRIFLQLNNVSSAHQVFLSSSMVSAYIVTYIHR